MRTIDTAQGAEQKDTAPDLPATLPPVDTDPALKEKYQRLFQRGLKWLGAGIFLMAVSFGINFFLFQTEVSFVNAMYILTSLGAVCITKGLVDILGF